MKRSRVQVPVSALGSEAVVESSTTASLFLSRTARAEHAATPDSGTNGPAYRLSSNRNRPSPKTPAHETATCETAECIVLAKKIPAPHATPGQNKYYLCRNNFSDATKRRKTMNAKAKGYLLGAIAAATYGMNPLFALPLYTDGMDTDSVLFFRYLFALPMLGAMLRFRGRNFRLERRQILPLILLGLLIAISSLTLFMSYNYMDAGIASTLLFVYPILVALIMALFFRERLTLLTSLCIVLALGGIALLYRSADGATLSLTGTLLVLASALAYAIYIVGVNRPVLQSVATLKITFYVLLFGLVLFLIRLDFGTALTTPQHWYLWSNLIALALFPTAISFLCTTAAIQHIGSTPTAILGALEPVTAVFFGVTIFGEAFTPRIACGILLIIAAVTLIVAGNRISGYLVRFRKLFPRLPRHHLKRQ